MQCFLSCRGDKRLRLQCAVNLVAGVSVSILWFSACALGEPKRGPPSSAKTPAMANDGRVIATQPTGNRYPWLNDNDRVPVKRLDNVFHPPDGFARVHVGSGTFGAWLRGLPIRQDRTRVYSFRRRLLQRPSAAIVHLDVGHRDLQQCADSAIRLHAEFLWSKGQKKALKYHFTSGDLSRWETWQKGERFIIDGSQVTRKIGPLRNDSHESFRTWLDLIFMYAGSLSIHRDTTAVGDSPFEIGDIFVQGGRPGHVVMILDMAEDAKGKTVALIGQGFMPAEDFHILQDDGPHVVDGQWFILPTTETGTLPTPSWPSPFTKDQARRFQF